MMLLNRSKRWLILAAGPPSRFTGIPGRLGVYSAARSWPNTT